MCISGIPVEEALDVLLDDYAAVPESLPSQLLHVGHLPRPEEQLRLAELVPLLIVEQLIRVKDRLEYRDIQKDGHMVA